MADNVTIKDANDLDVVVAADDVSGAILQRVKLVHGADGVNAGDVATGNPLPVVQTGTPALPTGAATSAAQSTSNTNLSSIDSRLAVHSTSLAAINGDTTSLVSAVLSNRMQADARLDTDAIRSAGGALTPKFAKISAASSGNNTLVAAVVSKKIRVLSYRFQSDADVAVKFQDGAGGTDLTGAMSTGARGGGGDAPFSPVGHFETTANTLLNLSLSSAVQTSGHLTYIEV